MGIDTQQDYSTQLIEAIKKAMPNEQPVASYLINLLPLGREAVYRRVRGEISFSLTEIALIANDLNISIDNILSLIRHKLV